MNSSTPLVAIVPAAGIGSRMGQELPKQYLTLQDKTLLEHTLIRLLSHDRITQIIVPLHPDDPCWSSLSIAQHPQIKTVLGGACRATSVLNGLNAAEYGDEVWALVHDAARPCVRHQDIDALIQQVMQSQEGCMLGMPVRDTMKRLNESQCVEKTVSRERLWHALTPQLFAWNTLQDALNQALKAKLQITDEASAMEAAGYPVHMIQGHFDNIKITYPEDLTLAGLYLQQQDMTI